MAESFGTIPFGVFRDQRTRHLEKDLKLAFATLVGVSDDWSLLEGDVDELSLFLRVDRDALAADIQTFFEMGLIDRYEARGAGGVARAVIEIVDALSYEGQPLCRTAPTKRRKSVFPRRDGTTPPRIPHRRRSPEPDPHQSPGGSEGPETGDNSAAPKKAVPSPGPGKGDSGGSEGPRVGTGKRTQAPKVRSADPSATSAPKRLQNGPAASADAPHSGEGDHGGSEGHSRGPLEERRLEENRGGTAYSGTPLREHVASAPSDLSAAAGPTPRVADGGQAEPQPKARSRDEQRAALAALRNGLQGAEPVRASVLDLRAYPSPDHETAAVLWLDEYMRRDGSSRLGAQRMIRALCEHHPDAFVAATMLAAAPDWQGWSHPDSPMAALGAELSAPASANSDTSQVGVEGLA